MGCSNNHTSVAEEAATRENGGVFHQRNVGRPVWQRPTAQRHALTVTRQYEGNTKGRAVLISLFPLVSLSLSLLLFLYVSILPSPSFSISSPSLSLSLSVFPSLSFLLLLFQSTFPVIHRTSNHNRPKWERKEVEIIYFPSVLLSNYFLNSPPPRVRRVVRVVWVRLAKAITSWEVD